MVEVFLSFSQYSAQNAFGANRCSACLGALTQPPFKLSVPVVLFISSSFCACLLPETCRSRSQCHSCGTENFQVKASQQFKWLNKKSSTGILTRWTCVQFESCYLKVSAENTEQTINGMSVSSTNPHEFKCYIINQFTKRVKNCYNQCPWRLMVACVEYHSAVWSVSSE